MLSLFDHEVKIIVVIAQTTICVFLVKPGYSMRLQNDREAEQRARAELEQRHAAARASEPKRSQDHSTVILFTLVNFSLRQVGRSLVGVVAWSVRLGGMACASPMLLRQV